MATGGVLIRLEVTGFSSRRRVIGVVPAIKEWRVQDDRRAVVVRSPSTAGPQRSRPERGQVRGTPGRTLDRGQRSALAKMG